MHDVAPFWSWAESRDKTSPPSSQDSLETHTTDGTSTEHHDSNLQMTYLSHFTHTSATIPYSTRGLVLQEALACASLRFSLSHTNQPATQAPCLPCCLVFPVGDFDGVTHSPQSAARNVLLHSLTQKTSPPTKKPLHPW